jgi:hypothetical protein
LHQKKKEVFFSNYAADKTIKLIEVEIECINILVQDINSNSYIANGIS